MLKRSKRKEWMVWVCTGTHMERRRTTAATEQKHEQLVEAPVSLIFGSGLQLN
jgi:hypothetical protein